MAQRSPPHRGRALIVEDEILFALNLHQADISARHPRHVHVDQSSMMRCDLGRTQPDRRIAEQRICGLRRAFIFQTSLFVTACTDFG